MHASTVSKTTPKQTIKTTTTTTLKSSTSRRNAANTPTTATTEHIRTTESQQAGSTITKPSTATTPKMKSSNITKTTQASIIAGTTNNTTINNNNKNIHNIHHQNKQQQQPPSDATHEIEEISKKISEHADAIYRTWKSRGMAPTELLEFYTNAAAATVGVGVDNVSVGVVDGPTANDFFTTNADVKTTEGLQKLVNSFVIKDKEQRGVNVKESLTSSVNVGKTTWKEENVKTGQKSKGSSGSAKADGDDTRVTSIKKNTKNSTTAQTQKELTATESTPLLTGNLLKNNACVNSFKKLQPMEQTAMPNITKNEKALSLYESKLLDEKANVNHAKKSKTLKVYGTTKTTKSTTSKSNTNFDFDLNLTDVNDLSQLQTQNLQKIKELLQHEPTTSSYADTQDHQSNGYKLGESLTNETIQTVTPTMTARKAVKKSTTTKLKNDNKINVVPGVTLTNKATKTKTPKTNNNVATSPSSSSYSATDLNTFSTTDGSMIDNSAATAAALAFGVIDVVDEATKLASPLAADHITSTNADKNSETKRAAIQVAKLQQDTSHQNIKQQQKPQETINLKINNNKICKTPTTTTLANNTSVPPNDQVSTKSRAVSSASGRDHAVAVVDSTTPVMEVARSTMPTPTKMKSTRSSLSNGQDKNLGRPILTRGSVAERVMMFEKCPDVRNSFLNIKRPDPADAPPKNLLKVKLHATPPVPPEQNSLQKEIRNTKSVYIPRFYFPHGKPQPQIALERTLRGILSAFDSFPNNQVTKDELPRILKLCGIPFYWRMPVMVFCQQGNSGLVERQRFVEFWKQMNVYCHDAASRFVYILSRGQRVRSYILPEDLAPMVQDVVDTHPGLAFLKEATEFHSRYVHTVIARIFYSVNRSWSGRISIAELKKSDLLEIITMLEEEDDINQIMAFFSYEHFYVIYCKFWELDKDHDLLINQEDLARHSDHALSTRIVERILSGCVTRSDNKKNDDDEPKMSYTDFVWFLLSEEDKRTPTAIEYWFRCMDVDGDGVLSMYELEYFYEEQQQRMESIGIETLPFEDCLCQMLDMIKPQRRDCVTLGDLKKCKMTHVFFDTFFNLEKYLDHEQRDPFATQRDEYSSDWDRFAAQEYELLITEENE